MTTPEAAARYLAEHEAAVAGRPAAVHNPKDRPAAELPAIFGFNNGGSPGWFQAVAIAEDGTGLGSHVCSAEGYMPCDLGILEGTAPKRHEIYREHYPDGYRMVWIPSDEIDGHAGLARAFELNKALAEAAGA